MKTRRSPQSPRTKGPIPATPTEARLRQNRARHNFDQVMNNLIEQHGYNKAKTKKKPHGPFPVGSLARLAGGEVLPMQFEQRASANPDWLTALACAVLTDAVHVASNNCPVRSRVSEGHARYREWDEAIHWLFYQDENDMYPFSLGFVCAVLSGSTGMDITPVVIRETLREVRDRAELRRPRVHRTPTIHVLERNKCAL